MNEGRSIFFKSLNASNVSQLSLYILLNFWKSCQLSDSRLKNTADEGKGRCSWCCDSRRFCPAFKIKIQTSTKWPLSGASENSISRFLAALLWEMERTKVIQHKILSISYLHRFFCSNLKSFHNTYIQFFRHTLYYSVMTIIFDHEFLQGF